MVVAVAQQPGFADRAITWQMLGKQVGQTPPTPQPILIDWLKTQWI
jgi:hypothetical protein